MKKSHKGHRSSQGIGNMFTISLLTLHEIRVVSLLYQLCLFTFTRSSSASTKDLNFLLLEKVEVQLRQNCCVNIQLRVGLSSQKPYKNYTAYCPFWSREGDSTQLVEPEERFSFTLKWPCYKCSIELLSRPCGRLPDVTES